MKKKIKKKKNKNIVGYYIDDTGSWTIIQKDNGDTQFKKGIL
jgi:hypothetical protein